MGRLGNAFLQILLGRTLGPAGFGLFATGWVAFQSLLSVSALGFDVAVTKFGARAGNREQQRTVVAECLTGALASAILVSSCLAAVATGVAVLADDIALARVLIWVAIGLPFSTLLRTAAAYHRLRLEIGRASVIQEVLPAVVAIAILVPLRGPGLDPTTAIAVLMFARFVALLIPLGTIAGPIASRRQGLFKRSSVKDYLRYGIRAGVGIAVAGNFLMVNRLAVVFTHGRHEVGLYQAASQVAALMFFVPSAVSMVQGPLVAHAWASGATDDVQAALQTSTRWTVFVGSVMAVTVLSAPRLVAESLFGSAYSSASTPLVVLVVANLVGSLRSNLGSVFVYSEMERTWLRLSVISVTICGLLTLGLSVVAGLTGAAVAALIATSAYSAASIWILRRQVAVVTVDRYLVKILLAALIAGGLILVTGLSTGSGVWDLVLRASLVALVTLVGCWLSGMHPEDRDLFQRIGGLLTAWRRTSTK